MTPEKTPGTPKGTGGDPWRSRAFVRKMEAHTARILADRTRCRWCGRGEAVCRFGGGCCASCNHGADA